MKIIKYQTAKEIVQKAILGNYELFFTDISISFRIFENKNTKELHIHYF
jgi:hypothetical protein